MQLPAHTNHTSPLLHPSKAPLTLPPSHKPVPRLVTKLDPHHGHHYQHPPSLDSSRSNISNKKDQSTKGKTRIQIWLNFASPQN